MGILNFTSRATGDWTGGLAAKLADGLPLERIAGRHRYVTLDEFRAGAFFTENGTQPWRGRVWDDLRGTRKAGHPAIDGGRLASAVAGGPGGFLERRGRDSVVWGVRAGTLIYAAVHRGSAGSVKNLRDTRIPITEKMRRFLAFHGKYLNHGKTHIIIPARPWGGDSAQLREQARQELALWLESIA